MNRTTRRLLSLAVLAVLVAACSSAAAPSGAPGSARPSAGASQPGAADPTARASGGGAVTSADQAAAAVLATDARFADLKAFNPDLIGQCCFYKVQPSAGGWTVTVEIGWGDCPSGCIDKHQWTYTVTPAGAVTLTGESGPPIPSGIPGGA